MNAIIDLGSEVLLDRSSIRDPYMRLIVASIGRRLVDGSPWVVVDKQLSLLCGLPLFWTDHKAQGSPPRPAKHEEMAAYTQLPSNKKQ
jgi:hypothetical protein